MEAKLFKAKKPDRTIVLECNGRDCTNSMMRCGTAAPSRAADQMRLALLVDRDKGDVAVGHEDRRLALLTATHPGFEMHRD